MADVRATVEAVWRIEAPRLIGGLVRVTRDLDRAEDLAQDALLVALEKWPVTGIPDNPGAWLMTAAKHRAVDGVRHRVMAELKHGEIAKTTTPWVAPDTDTIDDEVKDDVLRLMLVACHPVLSKESR
jgi:predicted RNA polymerase sigma factor